MEPAKKWIIEYHQEDKIVFEKNTEALNWDETRELTRQVVAAMREHNTNKLLIQHCGEVKLSILEIDKLPDVIKGLDIRDNDRVAIFYRGSPAIASILNFVKNVFAIKSHNVRLFADKDKAVAWLKSEL